MSKLNRKDLHKMILSEMKMLGMADLEPMGGMMGGAAHGHDDAHGEDVMAQGHKGSVSREDCCAAVLCLVECCSCPATKAALMACCEDVMAGRYDK